MPSDERFLRPVRKGPDPGTDVFRGPAPSPRSHSRHPPAQTEAPRGFQQAGGGQRPDSPPSGSSSFPCDVLFLGIQAPLSGRKSQLFLEVGKKCRGSGSLQAVYSNVIFVYLGQGTACLSLIGFLGTRGGG